MFRLTDHTATHCNTLQHTATRCNTLQHAATRCNTLQHTATHCNILQHTATHCNTLQHRCLCRDWARGAVSASTLLSHCPVLDINEFASHVTRTNGAFQWNVLSATVTVLQRVLQWVRFTRLRILAYHLCICCSVCCSVWVLQCVGVAARVAACVCCIEPCISVGDLCICCNEYCNDAVAVSVAASDRCKEPLTWAFDFCHTKSDVMFIHIKQPYWLDKEHHVWKRVLYLEENYVWKRALYTEERHVWKKIPIYFVERALLWCRITISLYIYMQPIMTCTQSLTRMHVCL